MSAGVEFTSGRGASRPVAGFWMAGGSLLRRDGHSSGTLHCCAPRATNPDDKAWTGSEASARAGACLPIRFCFRWGWPCRPRCLSRGALLPHLFTPPAESRSPKAVRSLWCFPWGRPRRTLSGTVFPWSPDFPLLASESGRPADLWRGGDARWRGPRWRKRAAGDRTEKWNALLEKSDVK